MPFSTIPDKVERDVDPPLVQVAFRGADAIERDETPVLLLSAAAVADSAPVEGALIAPASPSCRAPVSSVPKAFTRSL